MSNPVDNHTPTVPPVWLVQVVVFLIAAITQALFWRWTSPNLNFAVAWPLISAGLLLSLVAAWSCGLIMRTWRKQQQLQQRLEQSEASFREMKLFLHGSIRMDTELFEAADESRVMETTLSVLSELTGAVGASFVPLDEWGQPLPATVHGSLPALQRKSWLQHLSSPETRQVCRTCRQHQALPGHFCPLMDGPFSDMPGLYCFPLNRSDRLLGMVNLYLPGTPGLSEQQTSYLTSLLNEAAIAVETIRMRTRELSTLNQVQMLRPPQMDLSTLLGGLLDGLRQALEVEGVLLVVRSAPGSPRPFLDFRQGQTTLLDGARAEQMREQVLEQGRLLVHQPGEDGPGIAAAPLTLPEGLVLGALLAAGNGLPEFNERKIAILQSVADQAALLVENERMIHDIEYRTLIQERARLAREIHDGLAQTLAFLKLQASQMQTYLAQGNLTRLSLILKQNYETLAEAYLDTRQAIDDLRLNPRQGLSAWLEQQLNEFETASGLKVERQLNLSGEPLSPEVQAQMVRIVQEALSNIRKHARASQVRVSVLEWNGDVVVEVQDNGQGFSPDEVPGLSQYGLRGMRERAELIGADFQVISKPNAGTTVRLSVPKFSQEPLG